MTAIIYSFETGRRINHLTPVPDELTQAERDYYQARYDEHTKIAETHWRLAEPYARKLGYIGIEKGLTEFNGEQV